MKKNSVKKQSKQKKKDIKKKKKKLKKQNREARYFTRTKNILASVYFIIMITIAMLILLAYLGIYEI